MNLRIVSLSVIFCVLYSCSIHRVQSTDYPVFSGPVGLNGNCEGPLKFYWDLGCTPIFESEYEGCPIQYECKSIEHRDRNKCYIRNEEYSLGTQLVSTIEHRQFQCQCNKWIDMAHFDCEIVSCSLKPPPGCWRTRVSRDKCYGPVQCVRMPGTQSTCLVDGKVYKYGEYFNPAGEPWKKCYCDRHYTGKNVEPSCTGQYTSLCHSDILHGRKIAEGCVPVYENAQSLKNNCPLSFRCPTKNYTLVRNNSSPHSLVTCQFGNLTMNYGDELILTRDDSSKYVRCACVVGPVPSCLTQKNDKILKNTVNL